MWHLFLFSYKSWTVHLPTVLQSPGLSKSIQALRTHSMWILTSQQAWLQVNGWIGFLLCLILSTRGSKRVPLSVQLDKAAAEGPRLENVCHSSFTMSPLYRDMSVSHRVEFLWVQDSLHCFFKVCLLNYNISYDLWRFLSDVGIVHWIWCQELVLVFYP